MEETCNASFWYKFHSTAFKKNSHAQQQNYEKFSSKTTILEHQNNKKYRFSKHYILETCNLNLTELIIKPVLMYLNIFSYWHYLLKQI